MASPTSDARVWICVLLLQACGATATARAADAGHAHGLTVAADWSDVRILGRDRDWRTQRLQWDRRSDAPAGSLYAAVERQSRDGDADAQGILGGHRLWDRWVAAGELSVGNSGNVFVPRHAIEASVGYRIRPDFVVRVGTRQARYADSRLELATASAIAYRGDAEWELGWRGGRAGRPSRSISVGQFRGQWACATRWTCGFDLRGGRNVFGADEIGLDTGSGWIGGLHATYRLAAGHALRVDVASGRADDFTTRTVGLSYRHALRR